MPAFQQTKLTVYVYLGWLGAVAGFAACVPLVSARVLGCPGAGAKLDEPGCSICPVVTARLAVCEELGIPENSSCSGEELWDADQNFVILGASSCRGEADARMED